MRRTLGRIAVLLVTMVLMTYGINAPPVQAAAVLNVSASSGTPGTVLGISGTGWASGESIQIKYDGTPLGSVIYADGSGNWSTSVTVPHSPSGSHSIAAAGTTNSQSTTFTVMAGVTVSQTSGPVGATVTINGIGFGNQETGINVQYDGTTVAPGATSSALGDFAATFAIPASPSGSHSITAYGSITPVTRTIIFTVTPGVAINKTSGAPGASVGVSGSGFAANESGITINYDGTALTTGVIANSLGTWSATITVPASPAGNHVIHAYGATTLPAATSDIAFTVGAGVSASQTTGPPGNSITVSGSGFGASETGITVTYDSTTVTSGIRANGQGAWTATFTVPNSPSGSHNIGAYGATTSGASGVTFTLTPVVSAAQPGGFPGNSLTVTGSGFGASETGITITWDGNSVASSIRANAQGGWTGNFVIPPSPAGPHAVHAYGATTQATATSDVIFNVGAGVALSQTSGAPGSSISVTGAGFGASETGITVTYDGANVATGIRANAQGNFTATFNVPNSAAGPHTLHSYGATTLASTTADVVFTVTPGISVSQTSGAPGSSMTISGSGFGSNETGITVVYDTTTVASGLRANAQGSWSTTFVVPPSAIGSHTIGASGAVTQAATVAPATFSTMSTLSLNPALGYVGGSVQVDGLGFAINSPLKLYYDDKEITPTPAPTTDPTGSFGIPITIPKSKAGAHTVRVVDGQRKDRKTAFTMDSTPPPVPAPQSPDDGARTGLLGGAMPTFRWANVTDPSGVSYQLQIDTSPDFSQPILDRPDLTTNRYTLTAAEALPLGEYYWRVKAIDNASNLSAWSQPRVLKAGLMAMSTLILMIIVVLAALAAAAWFFLIRRPALRRREAAAVGEAEGPRVVVTGQWRSIEAPSEEQPAKERPMPLRLALPQPTKGQKTLSTEEQARLKVIVDFAQSLPLVEAGYTTNWLLDLLESGTGIEASLPIYEQILKGDLQVHYEPAWIHHPTYQDLTSLLEGQPALQDLNAFVDAVNRCASDAASLLQEMYRDCVAEVPQGFLEKGGWTFISSVYNDATSWFMGKSLRDPSEREYSTKPRADDESGTVWLWGDDTTSFAGPLIQAADEREALKLRGLHLKLRRNYRNNAKAKDVVGTMTQLEVQRSRLLNVFSQFGRLRQ